VEGGAEPPEIRASVAKWHLITGTMQESALVIGDNNKMRILCADARASWHGFSDLERAQNSEEELGELSRAMQLIDCIKGRRSNSSFIAMRK